MEIARRATGGMVSRKGPTALAGPVLVALAACAVVAPSLGGDFLNWDDDRFVVDNEHVASLSADNVAWAFSDVRFELYQPLYLVSFMVDGALWGGHPLGYRLHNLALFMLCSVLVYALLRRFGFARLGATAGALLFAVAPYRVESAAWISSRKDLLMLAFGLLAWLLHLAEAPTRGRAVAQRALAAVAFGAALLSKTGAVALPAAFFAADLLLVGIGWRRAAVRSLPYLFPAAAAAVSAPLLWANVDLIAKPSDPSAFGRLCLAGWTIAHYAKTALWPFDLSPLYGEPSAQAQRAGAILAAALVVVSVATLAVARSRGLAWRPFAAALAVFSIGVAPFSNAVPLYYFVSDRYLLVPSLGLAIAAAEIAARTLRARRRWLRAIVGASGLALLSAFTLAAANESWAWRSSRSLWEHAVAREPDAFYARLKLGETLREGGEPSASADQYRAARRLRPGSPTALAGVFWGELNADADTLGIAGFDGQEQVARFLAAVDDGAKLLALARDLKRSGFVRASKVALERFREWRFGGAPAPGTGSQA